MFPNIQPDVDNFIGKLQYLIGEYGYQALKARDITLCETTTGQILFELSSVLDYFSNLTGEETERHILQKIDFLRVRYKMNNIPYIFYPSRITNIINPGGGPPWSGGCDGCPTLPPNDGKIYVIVNGNYVEYIPPVIPDFNPNLQDVTENGNSTTLTIQHADAVVDNESATLGQVKGLIQEIDIDIDAYTRQQSDDRFYPLNENPSGYLTEADLPQPPIFDQDNIPEVLEIPDGILDWGQELKPQIVQWFNSLSPPYIIPEKVSKVNIVSYELEDVVINCGASNSYGGGQAYPTANSIYLGLGSGTVTLNYQADGRPDRFIVIYNGETVIDTGYRGASTEDFGGSQRNNFKNSLTGKVDPILNVTYPDFGIFPDDGYPRVLGSGLGSASFLKNSTVDSATVNVYGPQANTGWNYTLSCPNNETPVTPYGNKVIHEIVKTGKGPYGLGHPPITVLNLLKIYDERGKGSTGNAGITPPVTQGFDFSGSNNFTLQYTPIATIAVTLNGNQLPVTPQSYSINGNILTINYSLEPGDYIQITYLRSEINTVGVSPEEVISLVQNTVGSLLSFDMTVVLVYTGSRVFNLPEEFYLVRVNSIIVANKNPVQTLFLLKNNIDYTTDQTNKTITIGDFVPLSIGDKIYTELRFINDN